MPKSMDPFKQLEGLIEPTQVTSSVNHAKMTKSSDVEVIVDHMIDYMISINYNQYKTEIASRCVELAEQFAPCNHWFIR